MLLADKSRGCDACRPWLLFVIAKPDVRASEDKFGKTFSFLPVYSQENIIFAPNEI